MGYEKAKQKSRRALKDAMLTLLRANPCRSVTVTELCAVSRLNRSTFYMHYHSIDQLICDLHNDLFEQMKDYLHLTPHSEHLRDEALFTNFLLHISQEDDRFRLFLRADRSNLFMQNMAAYFLKRLCPADAPAEKRNSLLYHMVGAFTLLCTWIHEGYPISAADLSRQIITLSQNAKRP